MPHNELRFDYIHLDKIEVSEWNVRKTKPDEALEELAKSIKLIGLQQPVVVFRDGDKFKLIIGQRRYLACKKIGEEKIPAVIVEARDKTNATLASFSENIHRLDLDYRDKMLVATELLQDLGSVDSVAERLGVTSQTVRNYIGYAAVPEPLRQMVSEGKLSATTATRIARNIPDEKKAVEVAQKVREEPSSDKRIQIIQVAKENPSKNVDEVTSIVEKTKFSSITLDLTPKIAEALERASKNYQSEREAIATWAIEEWLEERGFFE